MKKSYIIIILFLGIFFIPNNTFACGSEKQSCKKELSTTKTKEKSCCDNNNDNKGCNGSCGHSNCTTVSSVGFSLFIYNEIEFTNNNFDFSTSKSKFYHSENLLSDGFPSIWLIPKIS
ncbi:hypothetical protein FIA58_016480 [Flavobacterium jejuense]|jgi:hypothetical protein|uniref:Secreted protein n=1 Tax=Flavobacterium jejuense TaxID=1544455 RepID=A0ABX0IZ56_9FLAO|nr:hypothetical protein [Flavobacterium jejuense]NHN27281.1 hypothetical protein [Flavobacterium jejuense]